MCGFVPNKAQANAYHEVMMETLATMLSNAKADLRDKVIAGAGAEKVARAAIDIMEIETSMQMVDEIHPVIMTSLYDK